MEPRFVEVLGRVEQEKLRNWLAQTRKFATRTYPQMASLFLKHNLNLIAPYCVLYPVIGEVIPGWIPDLYDDSQLARPGYGVPLDWLPDPRFPVLFQPPRLNMGTGQEWAAATLLIREVCMLKLVDDLTDRSQWWREIRDPTAAARWRAEALETAWHEYRNYGDFTPKMVDACFDEIRRKADLYEKTDLIPVFDYSVCVIKSDTLIPQGLCDQLIAAVEPLENVPDEAKDWQPGSGGKILNLVDPSLWPLVYGRSTVLPHKRIPVQGCLSHCGLGDAIPEPDPEEAGSSWGRCARRGIKIFSTKFQWLPCDVTLGSQGNATIDSYINNLHPVAHAKTYSIIQQFIKASLPAWDLIYRWPDAFRFQRLTTNKLGFKCLTPEACEGWRGCEPYRRPICEGEEPRDEDEHESFHYETSARAALDDAWFDEMHPVEVPDASVPFSNDADPDENDACRIFPVSSADVKSSGFFGKAPRIQVVVKLVSIHLTPENPAYDGGSWHIEGQLNEHICATALFYYSSHNITPSRLAFRAPANRESLRDELDYDREDHRSILRTFAISSDNPRDASTLQDFGSVLARQGRAVFFPNVLQSCVEPFELADKTRPGHRKVLALFLVDPAVPILSTANVPPQQGHWWSGKDDVRSSSGLPPELTDMVLSHMNYMIEEDEAKALREELMAERKRMQDTAEYTLDRIDFGL